jgi:hypothetical protein
MVHFAVIEGDGFRRLFPNEQVEYEVTRGPRGLQATRVRRINAVSPVRETVGQIKPSVDSPISKLPRAI